MSQRSPVRPSRVLPRLVEAPWWVTAPVVAALLAGCWALVYSAGGTRTALPHLFYVPILVAALPAGMVGAVTAALGAALLCGPVMPLDVALGEPQATINWLIRGGFYVLVAVLAGVSSLSLRRSFQFELTQQLLDEATNSEHDEDAPRPSPEAALLIESVLDRSAFRMVFQPIYDFRNGDLVAAEALTRFDGDTGEGPAAVFAAAHEVGRGLDLEYAAVEAALAGAQGLPDEVALSFNASPGLLADTRLLRLVDAAGDRRLIVEVTEHAIVDDYRQLQNVLQAFRRRGVKLAVDDAGAGFASLRHIVKLHPEYIKLDHSLTQDLGSDPIRRALADCLMQFSLKTESAIIVEGVETQADLATWRGIGAHAGQGYLLGRPGPLPLEAVSPHLGAVPKAALWERVAS